MRLRPKHRKSSLRWQMPDWGPLRRLFRDFEIDEQLLDQFMFMFTSGSIRAYKHYMTRRYIFLDCSRAYRWSQEEGYRRIRKGEALETVLAGVRVG